MAITYNLADTATSIMGQFSMGSKKGILGRFSLDNSYVTGGYTISPAALGLARVDMFLFCDAQYGYGYDYDVTTGKLLIYGSNGAGTTGATSGGTPAGTNGTSAVSGTGAGTADAQVFTGTSSALNLATPTFSGTGYNVAGQIITTTDNQTMALNECAGMWFISDALATTAPALIISNAAAVAAAAQLTVIGTAPASDAGTYKIVSTIPVGTNATSNVTVSSLSGTAAAQVFTGSALATHTHTIGAGGAATEIANGTDLSAVALVEFIAIGA